MTNRLNVVYLDKINLFAVLGTGLHRLASGVADYLERRAAYNAVANLDDRLLADIGLDRGEIRNVVSGSKLPNGTLR
jgi:uncharacterized protein YjiS (DUF1127 family)